MFSNPNDTTSDSMHTLNQLFLFCPFMLIVEFIYYMNNKTLILLAMTSILASFSLFPLFLG
jgi:hypothetical protein